jgi:hypothetical protein
MNNLKNESEILFNEIKNEIEFISKKNELKFKNNENLKIIAANLRRNIKYTRTLIKNIKKMVDLNLKQDPPKRGSKKQKGGEPINNSEPPKITSINEEKQQKMINNPVKLDKIIEEKLQKTINKDEKNKLIEYYKNIGGDPKQLINNESKITNNAIKLNNNEPKTGNIFKKCDTTTPTEMFNTEDTFADFKFFNKYRH